MLKRMLFHDPDKYFRVQSNARHGELNLDMWNFMCKRTPKKSFG